MRFWLPPTLLAGSLLFVCACKSTSAGLTGTKDETGQFHPASQTNSIWREVWADGIEQVIKPAQYLPEIAQKMSGIWYCRSQMCGAGQVGLTNGTAIMSLEQATTASDHLVEYNVQQPAMYAYDPASSLQVALHDMLPEPSVGKSYTLVFTDDKHGELIQHAVRADGTIESRGGPSDTKNRFSFAWLEEGRWLRQTLSYGNPLPNYDLIQIVDVKGQRTPKYDLYLSDLAAKVAAAKSRGEPNDDRLRKLLVLVDADSDLGRGGPVPPEGGPRAKVKASADADDQVKGRDAADTVDHAAEARGEAARVPVDAAKSKGKH